MKKKIVATQLSLLMILLLILTEAFGIRAYASDKTLASGLAYDQVDSAIKEFIDERKETTAGLAYIVFTEDEDLSRGFYGYQDIENQIPVSEDTVFEWGSGSKVLIWVCAMQAKERGLIDFDTDINEYLPEGFLSNRKYDDKITMIDLMNHSAGFQDVAADLNIDNPTYFDNLEEALSAHKPDQIYQPGTINSYSNWGSALAAYIVGRVNGMEYSDYVHKNIFEPLGMEHSAIYMDLSDNPWVQENRKKLVSYNTDLTIKPYSEAFKYIALYPAGRCASTFGDYEKFAKAMLREDERIMSKETWEEMFTPTDYFADTGIPKNYHGLWGVYFAVPTIGHIGRTSGCSNYLLMDRQNKVASLFVSNQGQDLEYTENIRPLLYGDYSYSNYGTKPDLPKASYQNSTTIENGAFKFYGFYAGILTPFNVDNEFWAVSKMGDRTVVERSYFDFAEEPAGKMAFEVGLVLIMAILTIIGLVSLICRLILCLIRLVKRDKNKRKLALWSTVGCILPLCSVLLYFYAQSSLKTTSNHYVWAFAVIAVLTLVMIAMLIYGCMKNISADGLTKAQKAYNFCVVALLVVTVVFVCYWQMYMFWKI